MKVIWKYTLQITDRQTVEMPIGARILSVQPQYPHDKVVQVWALVDDQETGMEEREFMCCGTGHPVYSASTAVFLGTVVMFGGDLVSHFFELQ